ncbi:hypothetical protein HW132_01875 [Brasilonema sp. CT11]|nr:hypothetical protein [Brasilonema sp. CT11]
MKQAIVQILSGAYSLIIRAVGLTQNIDLTAPTSAPTSGQVLRASSATTLEWATIATGGGTVTSVAVTAPSTEFDVSGSPVTTNGTVAIAWKNQSQNTILAAPSSGTGAPTFRSLDTSDIPALDAGKITSGTFPVGRLPVGTTGTTVAAGNDSRFHVQNTDTGTSSASFAVNNTGTGFRLVDMSGAMAVRNLANTGLTDIICYNLTVQGTQTIVNSEQVEIADNIIRLNSNYTGSNPTEDGGIEVNRGTLAAARLYWSETTQKFMSGLAGAEKAVVSIVTQDITNASLSSGVYTWAHGLGRKPLLWAVWDNTGDGILIQPNTVNANTMTFNFAGQTLTGTWTLVAAG